MKLTPFEYDTRLKFSGVFIIYHDDVRRGGELVILNYTHLNFEFGSDSGSEIFKEESDLIKIC